MYQDYAKFAIQAALIALVQVILNVKAVPQENIYSPYPLRHRQVDVNQIVESIKAISLIPKEIPVMLVLLTVYLAH